MAKGGPVPKTRADDRRGARKGATSMDGAEVGGHGGSIGQEPFVPTDAQRAAVLEYVAVGLVKPQIAQLIKHPDGRSVSVDTISRHFRTELDEGGLRAMANVGGVLYRGAMAGHPAFVRMYYNTHAHRFDLPTERTAIELTGEDGSPVQIEVTNRANEFTRAIARLATSDTEGSRNGEADGEGQG